MRYSEDLIEEVRTRNDIVDVVSGYVQLKRKGSSWFGLCPFHNEKSPSFSVSRDKQMYYCFGCQAGGNVITFLMEYENFTFTEALKALADRAGMTLPAQEYSREDRQEADLKSQLLEIHKEAAKYYFFQLKDKSGENAYRYLTERELSNDTIVRFGLGYSLKYSNSLYQYLKQKNYPDAVLDQSGLFLHDEKRGMHDKFWNRVMFPIMDVNNRVIAFGGRVMGDAKPKYLNSPETKIFDKSRNLYGLNFARTSRKKNLIVCEGYMDVISMHQAGFTNAVASLGTALTMQQAALMKRYVQEVLLLYDSDDAGQRAALRAIPILRQAGINPRVVSLSPYKDPDEFIKSEGREALEQRLNEAKNGFLFQVEQAAREYDRKDPQGQSDFLHRVAKMLLTFEDEIERNSYINSVAQEYHTNTDLLQRTVNKLAMREQVRPERSRRQENHEAPPEGVKRKKERQNGFEAAQRLLLTWIGSYPRIFDQLLGYISPEDFTDPLYRRVAELLQQQNQQGEVSPARLLNLFSDSEEQMEIAKVFNAQIPLENENDRDKALTDVVCRIKESSIAQRTESLDPTDVGGLMKIIEDKKKLEVLKKQKLNISFEGN